MQKVLSSNQTEVLSKLIAGISKRMLFISIVALVMGFALYFWGRFGGKMDH